VDAKEAIWWHVLHVTIFCDGGPLRWRAVTLFMHYFYNLSSASEGFTSRPPVGLHSWIP